MEHPVNSIMLLSFVEHLWNRECEKIMSLSVKYESEQQPAAVRSWATQIKRNNRNSQNSEIHQLQAVAPEDQTTFQGSKVLRFHTEE